MAGITTKTKTMPTYNGSVGSITAATECANRIGMNQLYLFKVPDLLTVTETGPLVSAITMTAGSLYKFDAEFADAEPRAELAEGSTRYQARIENIRFLGQDPATTLAIAQWLNTCNVGAIVVGVSGTRQFYGVENVNGVLKASAKKGKFVGHTNTFGTPNDTENGPRDEIIYLAEHDYAPLYIDPSFDLEQFVA